jgi:hypothetical protein
MYHHKYPLYISDTQYLGIGQTRLLHEADQLFPLCVCNHIYISTLCMYWANNAQNRTTIIKSTFNYTVLKVLTVLKKYIGFKNITRIIIPAKRE